MIDDARVLGGGQLFALRLSAAVRARGAYAPVIAAAAGSRFAELARAEGHPVADLPLPAPARPVAALRTLARLRAVVAAYPGAVVLANSLRAALYVELARVARHHPAVTVMHEQDSARRPAALRLLRRNRALLVVGSTAATAYAGALDGVSILKINNFLDEAVLALTPSRAVVPARPPRLAVVGRLIPSKGVVELVTELAAIRQAWSGLVIAGDSQDAAYADSVREAVRSRGLGDAVELRGHVDDVGRLLEEVDVLVVPSVGNEGQPTVVLEALAHGRPVVVRNNCWSPDYAGLPVTPYASPGDLEQALSTRPLDVDLRHVLTLRFGAGQVLEALEAALAAR